MNSEVLHIGVNQIGRTMILTLTGELDSYTSPDLVRQSKAWVDGVEKVVVNLDGLEYIDSSGLSALVGLWVDAGQHDAQMLLSCRNPRVYRVLEITGLLNLFTIMRSDAVVTSVTPVTDGLTPTTSAGLAGGRTQRSNTSSQMNKRAA